jgi:hypothetical protein
VSHTSWLTPRAELRDAGRKGLGIFAVDRIARGEMVAGFGGQVFEREEFDRLDAHRRSHSIQIDADLYLVSPTDLEPADYDEFVCECATPSCRGLVTGADWKRPELQARYAGHFSSYLAHRIAAEVTTRPGG